VIAKAFGIKISPNHCQSEENHARASLQIPAESKVNAAGMKSLLIKGRNFPIEADYGNRCGIATKPPKGIFVFSPKLEMP
jgi:hypothetical protein